MSADSVTTKLARLRQIAGPPAGVPLCMLPDPCGIYSAWSEAHEETERALAVWDAHPCHEAYCAYRAAADREDCAQDQLAARR
jgi:hypothetical protein